MKLAAIKPIATLVLKELCIAALLLVGVSFIVFVILYASPGNPFGPGSQSQIAIDSAGSLMSQSLKASWFSQYLGWLAGILRGDFGTSSRTGLPVLAQVIRVGINTLYLTIGSLLVTLIIAVPIATFAARRGITPLSWSATIFTYVLSALPVFWLGYIVIYISMHQFGLFPLAFGSAADRWNWIYYLLPVTVLGLSNGTVSEIVRFLREEIRRVFQEEYIVTARAKGASVWGHAFKEAFLLPVTSIIAAKIPFILGGAVVVEQVFNWPGMGRMAWQAAQDRDYALIMGITLLAAVFVRMGSLLQRVVHIIVNPRASQE